MLRSGGSFTDCYSTFCALSCTEDKLMLGQRGFDTVLLLRRRKTGNHGQTQSAELEMTAPGRNQGYVRQLHSTWN